MSLSFSSSARISPPDLAHCREMIRHGSRTFHAASLLLPPEVRAGAYALYAFCRLSDDAVDLGGGQLGAVDRLQARLDRIYEGRPLPLAPDRALAATVARHAVPRTLPEALLEGLAWDAMGRRYDNLSQLCDYAARVAGTVGAMMSVLMGARSPDMVARACDLGVAMQLTNIARDVGEDARMGRIYLPLEWLRREGVDADDLLAAPRYTDELGRVVRRLLEAADELYARAEAGIARLPAPCRPAIFAARLLYAEIGREVARHDFDSVSGRAVVPGRRKAALLTRAVWKAAASRTRLDAPPLAETRYLVAAVSASPLPSPGVPPAPPWWRPGERVGWVADLFHRLEEREAAERARAG